MKEDELLPAIPSEILVVPNALDSLLIDAINEEQSIELAAYLRTNTSLRFLHVSFIDDCNAARVIESVVRHTNIQNLVLTNVYMDTQTVQMIHMLLAYNDVLLDFTISPQTNSDSTDSLNALVIIEPSDLQIILLGLTSNDVLESLVLHFNDYVLDYDASLLLKDTLTQNRALRRLHLGVCLVPSAACAKAIGHGIVANSTLRHLGGLHFDLQDTVYLVGALSYNKTLQEFLPSLPSAIECYLELNRERYKQKRDCSSSSCKSSRSNNNNKNHAPVAPTMMLAMEKLQL